MISNPGSVARGSFQWHNMQMIVVSSPEEPGYNAQAPYSIEYNGVRVCRFFLT